MKLFRFIAGDDFKLAVFDNAEEAYARRAEVESTFHFIPVRIEEVTVPGYTIHAAPEMIELPFSDEPAGAMDDIRERLREKGVRFPPNTGEKRLMELAAEHLN